MAKNSIRDYSATAGSNTDIQSVDIDENCAASGINNALREIMVDLKNVSTGAVNLETPAADRLDVDNIRIDGNTISSTDTNGDINVIPNGTGEVVFHSTADSDNYVQVSSANNSEAGIRFRGDGSLGTGTDIGYEGNGNRFFISTVSSGTATERLSIDSSGNVGIGTTVTGDAELIVYGDDAGTIYKNSTTGTGGADGFYVGLGKSGGTDAYVYQRENTNLIFGTNDTERMRINSGGVVLIGTTSGIENGGFLTLDPAGRLNIGRTNNDSVAEFYRSGTRVGSIGVNTTNTAYYTSSDYRLKEAVVDMTGAIDRVKALAPKRFNFIADDSVTVDGFLAHEAQAVVPEAVTGTKDEVDDDGNAVMQGIDQSKLVPLLTGALQEAIAKIETLETEMTALKARVTALEA